MNPRMTDVVLPPTFEQTASFTPGPWHASRKSVFVNDIHNRVVAEVVDRKDRREANARLIAAAPELLAALERAREAVSAIVLSTHSVSFDADLRAIDAAIATAKGEA